MKSLEIAYAAVDRRFVILRLRPTKRSLAAILTAVKMDKFI
jgi:hypothetical protein